MALAVASTSTATSAGTTSLVITKPTGVAAGDLLVIVAGNTSSGAGVYSTCSGFTIKIQAQGGAGGAADVAVTYMYRIADSSDVSASNYTVTSTNNIYGAGMFRITGWTTGDPFLTTTKVNNNGSVSSISVTENLTRRTEQLLIMAGSGYNISSRTGSTYQITSSGSNPTWTELVDTYSTSEDRCFQCAYAIDSGLSTITNWGYTFSGAVDVSCGALGIINEPQNITSDVSHLAITPSVESVTVTSVNITADVSHLAVTAVINGIETSDSSPSTVWTTVDKT